MLVTLIGLWYYNSTLAAEICSETWRYLTHIHTACERQRERGAVGAFISSSPSLPRSSPTVLTLGAISLRSLSLVSSAHSVLWESTHWDCALIWICWCLCALHWPLVALFRWASCWLSLTRIYTIPWCWYLEATGSQLIQWVCCCWCTLLCSS